MNAHQTHLMLWPANQIPRNLHTIHRRLSPDIKYAQFRDVVRDIFDACTLHTFKKLLSHMSISTQREQYDPLPHTNAHICVSITCILQSCGYMTCTFIAGRSKPVNYNHFLEYKSRARPLSRPSEDLLRELHHSRASVRRWQLLDGIDGSLAVGLGKHHCLLESITLVHKCTCLSTEQCIRNWLFRNPSII